MAIVNNAATNMGMQIDVFALLISVPLAIFTYSSGTAGSCVGSIFSFLDCQRFKISYIEIKINILKLKIHDFLIKCLNLVKERPTTVTSKIININEDDFLIWLFLIDF